MLEDLTNLSKESFLAECSKLWDEKKKDPENCMPAVYDKMGKGVQNGVGFQVVVRAKMVNVVFTRYARGLALPVEQARELAKLLRIRATECQDGR